MVGADAVPQPGTRLTACGVWPCIAIDLSVFGWQSLRRSGIVRG